MASALQAWTDSHIPRPVDQLGLADVARWFRLVGATATPPNADEAAGAAAFMLVNVARGRRFDDHDLLREVVVEGLSAPTARRYRALHGDNALFAYLDSHVQYEQDLVALMRAGRKLPAARRYLERHPRTPSMAAYPAPPARRRRPDPPMDRDVVGVEGVPAPGGRADRHALHDDGEEMPAGAQG